MKIVDGSNHPSEFCIQVVECYIYVFDTFFIVISGIVQSAP